MLKSTVAALVLFSGTLMLLAGCSGTGAAITGGRMGMNLLRKDSHLKIKLDGQPAKQTTWKKAATGYSRFKIKEAVSTAPKLQFELENPDKFGRITMVSVSIYQKFEADYSHQAEFTVIARDTNNPEAQMKPGVVYDLGNPGPGFKVLNLTSQEVSGVTLKPGMKYMLALTVRADHSETAQVYFKTK